MALELFKIHTADLLTPIHWYIADSYYSSTPFQRSALPKLFQPTHHLDALAKSAKSRNGTSYSVMPFLMRADRGDTASPEILWLTNRYILAVPGILN